MTIIHYTKLNAHLTSSSKGKGGFDAPVFLLFGEEVIYKSALETLLDILVPASDRKFAYDPFDGCRENVPAAIRYLNTYSLSGGRKVVALLDSDIFYSKPRESVSSETVKTSAASDGIVDTTDTSEQLIEALTDGFPKNHFLIITAEMVDRRRRLFKIINDLGLIVDCSVPKGDRQADRAVQQSVLAMKKQEILGKSNKTISNAAFAALYELTGFDLRTFSNNLLKLVDFIGERQEITEEDVLGVLRRTKQDPIYEFTNAVTDKHLDDALFYLASLLSDGFHPLQLLAALTNQIRRLIVVKSFSENLPSGLWRADLPYHYFQKSILPLVVDYDKGLQNSVAEWDTYRDKREAGEHDPPGNKAAKKKKTDPVTDLLIAPNPKSPYPVYKSMQKVDGFTMKSLQEILRALSQADILLKSTDHSPQVVVEKIIVQICGQEET
jgi:DNA polymerase-3 subunit delta